MTHEDIRLSERSQTQEDKHPSLYPSLCHVDHSKMEPRIPQGGPGSDLLLTPSTLASSLAPGRLKTSPAQWYRHNRWLEKCIQIVMGTICNIHSLALCLGVFPGFWAGYEDQGVTTLKEQPLTNDWWDWRINSPAPSPLGQILHSFPDDLAGLSLFLICLFTLSLLFVPLPCLIPSCALTDVSVDHLPNKLLALCLLLCVCPGCVFCVILNEVRFVQVLINKNIKVKKNQPKLGQNTAQRIYETWSGEISETRDLFVADMWNLGRDHISNCHGKRGGHFFSFTLSLPFLSSTSFLTTPSGTCHNTTSTHSPNYYNSLLFQASIPFHRLYPLLEWPFLLCPTWKTPIQSSKPSSVILWEGFPWPLASSLCFFPWCYNWMCLLPLTGYPPAPTHTLIHIHSEVLKWRAC